MEVRAHVSFENKVQVVFFRSKIKRRAANLDLKEGARNLSDSKVEAVFASQCKSVDTIVEFFIKGSMNSLVINLQY